MNLFLLWSLRNQWFQILTPTSAVDETNSDSYFHFDLSVTYQWIERVSVDTLNWSCFHTHSPGDLPASWKMMKLNLARRQLSKRGCWWSVYPIFKVDFAMIKQKILCLNIPMYSDFNHCETSFEETWKQRHLSIFAVSNLVSTHHPTHLVGCIRNRLDGPTTNPYHQAKTKVLTSKQFLSKTKARCYKIKAF